MPKLIIAGGRDFSNYPLLKQECDIFLFQAFQEEFNLREGVTVISGTARGADQLGEQYAKEKGYKILSKPADWNKYGKRAGYLRNEEMAAGADALIAFWDGCSRGTMHMINIAQQHNLLVKVVRY